MNPEVFKQAQSRGWMEGWTFYDTLKTTDESMDLVILGQNNKNAELKLFPFNYILFNTNLCEKFFSVQGAYLDGVDECDHCFEINLLTTHAVIVLAHTLLILLIASTS